MRIVTWNMGCGWPRSRYRKHCGRAWLYLLGDLRPDVVLVQEAVLPADEVLAEQGFALASRSTLPGTDACTAVLAKRGTAREVAPIDGLENTLAAAATVQTPAGPLTVQSVHVATGSKQRSDLGVLTDAASSFSKGSPFLMGGDYNAARRFRDGRLYGWFFDAAAEAGLHEPHWAINECEVQSFWGPQAKTAYQLDHFFMSGEWASYVRSCAVVDNEVVREMSDHGALVLELDTSGE